MPIFVLVYISSVYDLLASRKKLPRQIPKDNCQVENLNVEALYMNDDNAATVRALQEILQQHLEELT